MAKVLDETALGARPTPEAPSGIARYRAEMPELEMGGQALRQVGGEIGSEADKLFTAYKHEQAKVDTLRAEDAYTQYQNQLLTKTYGPGGYATKRGQDAVLGLNIQEFSSAIEEDAKKIAAGLGNDEQKRLFMQRAMVAMTSSKEGLLRHQFKERNVWATDVTNNGVTSELNQISAVWSNPGMDPQAADNATSASLVRIRGLINAHADDLGKSETDVDNDMRKIADAAVTKKFLAWTQWDPVGAYDTFTKTQNEISDPAHRLTLRNTLWERSIPVRVGVESTNLLDQARKEAEPKRVPVMGEETFTNVVGSLIKREGGYVAKDGKSGAPANFGINQRANPDIDVANLTRAKAVEIYRERYWKAIGGDNLAPATALVALDTAALQGPAVAKQLLDTTGGDPVAMIAERRRQLQALATRDPAQAPYLAGWMNRLDGLQAEVQAMPEGGMRKVSSTDRVLTPDTSPLPTARQVQAELPLALMKVDERANALYGKDKMNPDRAAFVKLLEADLRAKNAHEVQMVGNQQREALQTVGNIVLGAATVGQQIPGAQAGVVAAGGGAQGPRTGAPLRLTSYTQLMANPVAAAAYQLLDFEGKKAVDTMLKVNANESERGDPELFNTIRNEIALGKFEYGIDVIKDPRVQTSPINIAQIHALQGWAGSSDRTQAGMLKQAVTEAKNIYFANDQVLKLTNTAGLAESLYSKYADKVITQFRKDNPGKPIGELLDPTNPKGLTYPPTLKQFGAQASQFMSQADALASAAGKAVAGTAPVAPPVPPPQAPASLKTPEDVAKWVQTLPPGATHFTDPNGVLRTIPGRQAPAAAAPAAPAPAGTAPDLVRPDGTLKGPGFLGKLQIPGTNYYATEYSVGVQIGGKQMDIPSLVPTLTKAEVDQTLAAAAKNEMPPPGVIAKATAFAEQRIKDGKPVFAQPGEKPAAAASEDAVPEFSASRLSPEGVANHYKAVWYAAGETLKAAGRTALEAGFALPTMTTQVMEWAKDAPAKASGGMFRALVYMGSFSETDIPLVRAALKYGDLDAAEKKKARAMLKKAGAD